MSEASHRERLSPQERARLRAWACAPPLCADLSERVVAAWLRERGREQGEADRNDQRSSAGAGRVRGTGVSRRWTTAAWAVAAAAVLVVVATTLWGWMEGIERRRRAERLATIDALAPSELIRLRGEVGQTLSEHCRPCHDGADEEASTRALAIFDFRQKQWWLTLGDDELQSARSRMAARSGLDGGALQTVGTYVAAELRFRERATKGRP